MLKKILRQILQNRLGLYSNPDAVVNTSLTGAPAQVYSFLR